MLASRSAYSRKADTKAAWLHVRGDTDNGAFV
jgi:hypothetical protein